jgi:signal transduction histidine kinase
MEAIGNLTGGMVHDLNNVLGVIVGNLDLLGRLIKDNAVAEELRAAALDGALRGAELIRRLLAFARRQSLRLGRTDVNALVEGIGRLLSRTLGEEIELTMQLDPSVWPALSDPAQLESALTNLATNARDAMKRGGRLAISTRNALLDAHYVEHHPEAAPGEYVLIEVSDTGTGIAPVILSRIFEPFFTTKEPGKGTGLGLSMVFGFVKQASRVAAARSVFICRAA